MNAVVDATAHKTLDHWLSQALALIHAQKWQEAEYACDGALSLDPYHAEANHFAGLVAGQIGKEDKGLAHLHVAITQDPSHPQYRYNYAVSLSKCGRENEAAIQYQACLRQEPNHRDALWNYGEMLRLAEHFDLACELLERFAAHGGDYPALNHRLGVIHSALHNDEAADAHFLKELGVAAEHADALTYWEYSLYLLSRERFAEGFAHYTKRFSSNGRNSVYCHDFGLPAWTGKFTSNSTLLIHGEQGLGDEMMFASVVPEVLALARATQSKVILAVKPGLVRLFASSFPSASVVSHRVGGPVADVAALGKIDWQLPMGDLPALFRFQLQDFQAARKAYLFACPQRTQWYAQQLKALDAPANVGDAPAYPKLKVGLMWGSNPAAINAKFTRWSQQRSVPVQVFERLAQLLPDVQFVSLQNAERGHEAALAPKLGIFDLSHLQTDFLETASLVANLDLVISVDTSVSHLAGAMGKETWVPLIYRSDWRHGNKRRKSYWYANTKYFHQSEAQSWLPVMEEIAAELKLRVEKMHEKHSLMHYIPEANGMPAWPIDADLAQAITFLRQRDFDQARPYFEKALDAQPRNPHVKWEFAMQLLTQEQWARGWDYHEARHAIFGAAGLNMCPLPWPQWQGETMVGRTIVVHGEQGIGDEIMYLSMLPDLMATGARVILACVPSLVETFQFSFPSIQVIPHPRGSSQKWAEALPFWTYSKLVGHVDYQIPVASLGKHFRRKATDFLRQPYLRADSARVLRMAQKLEEIAPSVNNTQSAKPLRVGLAWCGSLGDDNARARSMPLHKMQALIDVGKSRACQFVSLQSRQYAKQAAEVPEFGLIDMSEYTDDFADLAALMANLDLIISVDTSYGHLAAAMGLTTWRMVIRTCDWRWGWQRDSSVWYASDRLFRQDSDGDWGSVVKSVAAELEKF